MDRNETSADIAEKMRGEVLGDDGVFFMMDGRRVMEFADRFAAAAKRDGELLKANIARVRELEGMLGGAANTLLECAIRQKKRETVAWNAAKLREALEKALMAFYNVTGECLPECAAALSAPPRNCDVGTAAEQNERYKRFCARHYQANNVDAQCDACPCKEERWDCELEWGQMPYEAANGGAECQQK